MSIRTLVIMWAVMLSCNAFSQDYRDYQFEFFFGRQPSAKAEAMGQAAVANHDGAFTAFYNPAAMIRNKGLNVGYSYASPYYLADEADYTFFGATYNLGRYGAVGFNRFRLSFGEQLVSEDPSDSFVRPFTPTTTFYTFSYAIEIKQELAVGVNLNLYRTKSLMNIRRIRSILER